MVGLLRRRHLVVADEPIDRRHAGAAVEADPVALHRRAALGQQRQAVAAHVGGGVDQDVDLIGQDQLTGAGVVETHQRGVGLGQGQHLRMLRFGPLHRAVEVHAGAGGIVVSQVGAQEVGHRVGAQLC